MKILIKISVWVLVVLLVLLVSVGIFIRLNGKKILLDQIRENLQLEASLESISLRLPLTVELKGLKLGELASFERISLTPNLLGFLAGKIVIANLTLENSRINLIKSNNGSINLPKLKQGGTPPQIFITGLVVRNGNLIYDDRFISAQGLKTVLGAINCSVSKVMLPITSLKTNLDFNANLENPQGVILGNLSGKGWVDFGPKDLDMNFAVKDLDVVYFAPYYGEFFSTKKLLSAKLSLASICKAKNNDLTIATDFKLSNMVYAQEEPRQEGEIPQLNFMKNALDLFTDANGNLNLQFTIQTKLDHPELSIEQLKKVVFEAAAKNLSSQRPDQLIEKVQSTMDQFKDFGKQMEKIFKGKKE
ncbi:MAG: DUF748 domain-containing protein [Candidatus Omnitrophica bacterium]|nr:DUF748 domain-containing protein [Candidatus Omnitrophota bacterium]